MLQPFLALDTVVLTTDLLSHLPSLVFVYNIKMPPRRPRPPRIHSDPRKLFTGAGVLYMGGAAICLAISFSFARRIGQPNERVQRRRRYWEERRQQRLRAAAPEQQQPKPPPSPAAAP